MSPKKSFIFALWTHIGEISSKRVTRSEVQMDGLMYGDREKNRTVKDDPLHLRISTEPPEAQDYPVGKLNFTD